jgi:hypothetical protein
VGPASLSRDDVGPPDDAADGEAAHGDAAEVEPAAAAEPDVVEPTVAAGADTARSTRVMIVAMVSSGMA